MSNKNDKIQHVTPPNDASFDSENAEFVSNLSFRGNFTHSVDPKGRVSLPSEFRRLVQETEGSKSVVLTNYISDGARCLEGFSAKAWLQFETKLRAKSRFDPKLQKLENFYLSRAAECPIDQSGRILLPSHLRTYAGLDGAGLEGEVTFTSSIHGFRVWDKRVWNMIFEQAESALLENPALFAEIDI